MKEDSFSFLCTRLPHVSFCCVAVCVPQPGNHQSLIQVQGDLVHCVFFLQKVSQIWLLYVSLENIVT